MPTLTDQQRKFYETTLSVTRQEIADLQGQIDDQRAKFESSIAELRNAINASRQMYQAACNRLGIPDDLPGDPTED